MDPKSHLAQHVTLVPYQDMAADSIVTITGLTGTQTPDNALLPVNLITLKPRFE